MALEIESSRELTCATMAEITRLHNRKNFDRTSPSQTVIICLGKKGWTETLPRRFTIRSQVVCSAMKHLRQFFRLNDVPESAPDHIEIGSRRLPILFQCHTRAKRYIMRLRSDGTVLVTLPLFGSPKVARNFVEERRGWLEKQWQNLQTRKAPPKTLVPGMSILFRGIPAPITAEPAGELWILRMGEERVRLKALPENLRPVVEVWLRGLAGHEIIARAEELARLHGTPVRRFTIRNQRTRWGSCSRGRTISLNWRLIQLPLHVRDYIILHELMHLRELNHSPRFWQEVEQVCPNYLEAEAWLKQTGAQILF
jgi:predicted metal-dependent hydrolase